MGIPLGGIVYYILPYPLDVTAGMTAGTLIVLCGIVLFFLSGFMWRRRLSKLQMILDSLDDAIRDIRGLSVEEFMDATDGHIRAAGRPSGYFKGHYSRKFEKTRAETYSWVVNSVILRDREACGRE